MSVASLRYLSSGSTHLFGDVERVVHRVGRVRRVGRGLRRQVEQRLLPDLPGRHLLEAQLDAGQRLELRLQRDQVLEVARRDDGDGDRLALGLLPVDLGGAVRRELVGLREGGAAQQRSTMPAAPSAAPCSRTSRRVGWWFKGVSGIIRRHDDSSGRPAAGLGDDRHGTAHEAAARRDVGRRRATRSGA